MVAPRGMTVVAAEAASHQTAVADFPRGVTPTIVHSIPAQGTARLVPVKDILLHHGADLMRAVTEDHHIDQKDQIVIPIEMQVPDLQTEKE